NLKRDDDSSRSHRALGISASNQPVFRFPCKRRQPSLEFERCPRYGRARVLRPSGTKTPRDSTTSASRTPHQVVKIYKICSAPAWREAERQGVYRGSADDARDGFIHFSTAAQVPETARKHFF